MNSTNAYTSLLFSTLSVLRKMYAMPDLFYVVFSYRMYSRYNFRRRRHRAAIQTICFFVAFRSTVHESHISCTALGLHGVGGVCTLHCARSTNSPENSAHILARKREKIEKRFSTAAMLFFSFVCCVLRSAQVYLNAS